MTNPSDIARAMDAVQGLMRQPQPTRVTFQDLTWRQRCLLRLTMAQLHPNDAAVLADAFEITADDLKHEHEGEIK